jgi:hypothetical protein
LIWRVRSIKRSTRAASKSVEQPAFKARRDSFGTSGILGRECWTAYLIYVNHSRKLNRSKAIEEMLAEELWR